MTAIPAHTRIMVCDAVAVTAAETGGGQAMQAHLAAALARRTAKDDAPQRWFDAMASTSPARPEHIRLGPVLAPQMSPADWARLLAVVMTNGFDIDAGATALAGMVFSAAPARMNHACKDYASATYRVSPVSVTVWTAAPVAAGQEITVGYGEAAAARQFTCRCRGCANLGPPLQSLEANLRYAAGAGTIEQVFMFAILMPPVSVQPVHRVAAKMICFHETSPFLVISYNAQCAVGIVFLAVMDAVIKQSGPEVPAASATWGRRRLMGAAKRLLGVAPAEFDQACARVMNQ
jgi:hypothetical protein